jgi:transcriptional regulator with XRE-family HTH domain
MTLPEYMHMKRRQRQQTLEQLGALMGVSDSQLSRYERGLCTIKRRQFDWWCDAMQLTRAERIEALRLFAEGRK